MCNKQDELRLDELIKEIESLRQKLKDLVAVDNLSLGHPDVIKTSQELDKLLNKYNSIIK